MLEILFCALITAVLWTYAGYPCFLAVLAHFSRRQLVRVPIEPTVSLIITAYNEEKSIGRKIAAMLELDYPRDKLEIIVASDCSDDRTHQIVGRYAQQGVRLAALPQRSGKTAAQNLAFERASGEILVFTDATTEFRPDTVRLLVQGFADPRVGCIDAVHESISQRGTAVARGGRVYRSYETRIKLWEARVNSLVGVTGCLYAVRRSVYGPIPLDLISDFVIASEVFAKGYLVVSDSRIVTTETALEDAPREFNMRVRIVTRSINAIVREARMLNPFRYGFFSFQILSHKVLRYLVPEFLLAALVLSILLAQSDSPRGPLYSGLLAIQLIVYFSAVLGLLAMWLRLRVPLLHIPLYFAIANVAALWGMLLYLRGERAVTWTTLR